MNLTFLCQLVFGTSTRSRSPPEFSGGTGPTTGRDPKKKSGRDRPRVATQKKYPVETDHGSRPKKKFPEFSTEATRDTIFKKSKFS